jgi:uncharacterized RDD family membrane protein YckC
MEAGRSDSDEPRVVGRRIWAGLIDVLVGVAIFIAYGVIFAGQPEETAGGGTTFQLYNGDFFGFFACWLLYYFAFEALIGTTIGKGLLGLGVRRLDGSKPGAGAILGRTLLRVIDLLPFLYIVGLVAIAVSDRDQRLGDMAANTTVVRI